MLSAAKHLGSCIQKKMRFFTSFRMKIENLSWCLRVFVAKFTFYLS